jgi:polyphosphate kinase 2 (PPK2 family)
MLVEDGICLCKYWLATDQEEQEKRFAERAADPLKRWKLSPVDLEARRRYVEYGKARDAMFEETHTKHAPWHVVEFDDQRRGRLNLIDHFLRQIPYRRVKVPRIKLSPLRGKPAKEQYRGPVKPIQGRY